MKTHPTLYKKTSTGAIQYWIISVVDIDPPVIRTEYGQVGTENPQVTEDIIREGKNVGRANETSRGVQAHAEAKAKWTKQLKKGYVKSIAEAEAGATDAVIAGGALPMLAHKFKEHGHKIKYPALGQPKLDGIRCIAIKKGGVCTLWSRTRKPILSVPHIAAAVEALIGGDLVLDGELYNHDYRNDFEEIISLVRPDEPVKGHEVVQYHIYDTINGDTNRQRSEFLRSIFKSMEALTGTSTVGFTADGDFDVKWDETLQLVPTREIASASDVEPFYEEMRELGYEGAMMRNADGLYVPKRSYDLLKHKGISQDGEYKIVDFEEGRGRLQGHIGAFWCVTPEGKRFKAKLKGKTTKLKEYFKDYALWEGKMLTVQYQNFTAEGKPRFPIGIAIRDYE